MRKIRRAVVHCSATPNGDSRFTIEDLDRMHRERGWRKIGYHYVIECDGARMTGRALEEIGAHVAGSNADSVGICMVGTDKFSEAQWLELRSVCQELEQRFHGITFAGHRDYSPDKDGDGVIEPWEWFKLCPGFDVSAWRLSGMDPQWNMAHLLT